MCPIVATTLQSRLAGIFYCTYLCFSIIGKYKSSGIHERTFLNISGNKKAPLGRGKYKCEIFHVIWTLRHEYVWRKISGFVTLTVNGAEIIGHVPPTLIYSDDGGSRLLWNVGIPLPFPQRNTTENYLPCIILDSFKTSGKDKWTFSGQYVVCESMNISSSPAVNAIWQTLSVPYKREVQKCLSRLLQV